MHNLADRFSAIIGRNTPEKRRYAQMEAFTGIPAMSWNKAINGKQRPTAEMVQAVGRLWPEFAFWLVTGITDAKHGHISCGYGAKAFYPEADFGPRNAARPYFLQTLEMFTRTYGENTPFPDEVAEREARVVHAQLALARDSEDRALSENNSCQQQLQLALSYLAAAKSRALELSNIIETKLPTTGNAEGGAH